MRTFEVCGCGGIQLTPNNEEQKLFFTENKEIFFYNNMDDLISKIKFVLNLSVFEANIIRENAYLKSINNKYSYENRSNDVEKVFSILCNN
jgi:spore maturation protein CgeB